MIDGSFRDQTEAPFAKPFPEDHILIHGGRFDLLFGGQIEDLNGPRLGFESNDLSVPVHDSTIGVDRSLYDFIVVLEVDDDDLCLLILADLLTYADIMV